MQKPENGPKFLTQTQAAERSLQIKKNTVSYFLTIDMEKETFSGSVLITFDVNHINTNTFLDFFNSEISKITVNNKDVEQIQWDGLFITIPKELLQLEKNQIEAKFSCKYAKDGSGFHSFVDVDGKQYFYTQCEAYTCNRIFPNFDQPDIKATLESKLSVPNNLGWIVVANEHSSKTDEANGRKTFEFPKSKLLPTYLFGFVAGNYLEIKGQNTYNNIPMSLYCRESLLKHLEGLSDFIFETTNGAMKMYEEFFGVKYPFNKYDQIFCAEFNAGAMENAGLVTFNDLYLFREEVDSSKYTWLADVITHELSHHWFGNLVTMKWWNGLWLNESFADFISHFCLSKYEIKSKPTQNIWLAFNLRKAWGYKADQMVTTHPIAGEVPNTEAADSIFDGITYAKGAATLRQLLALIGEEGFSKGLNTYFTEFQWSNSTLDDFIGHLNVEFEKKNLGFNLKDWQEEWIQEAGLNECQPSFDPSNKNPDAQLIVIQTAALEAHPTLRRHKMKIAFFDENAAITSQSILLNPASQTQVIYDGSKNFKAVMLNYEDEAFIKVLLDDHSIEFFKENLYKVTDTLTRTLIWRAFYDMLRDGKLSSEEYIDIFVKQIPLEQSVDIVTNQFLFVPQIVNLFTPTANFRTILSNKLFQFICQYLKQIANNKALVLAVKQHLASFACEKETIQQLVDWYYGKNENLKEFEIGNALEWTIVSLVQKFPYYDKEFRKKIAEDQSTKDPSDTRDLQKIKYTAYNVTPEEREKLWNSYFENDNKLSLRQLQYSWAGFNNDKNEQEVKPYWSKWFDTILKVFKEKDMDFAKWFYMSLVPKCDDLNFLQSELQKILLQTNEEMVILQKQIKESLDDLERSQRGYQCFYQRAPMAK